MKTPNEYLAELDAAYEKFCSDEHIKDSQVVKETWLRARAATLLMDIDELTRTLGMYKRLERRWRLRGAMTK